MKDKTGYFVFSLDTELSWGYFDLDNVRRARFSADGASERKSIERLLDTLDEFAIAATWAVVGHMFYERCERCSICPIADWKGRYGSFEEVFETDSPLWYGADVIDSLLERPVRHEIAFHGYTHRVFDERTMGEEQARVEIREWLRLSSRKSIIPRSVVFPRNTPGHLQLFEEYGFLCYRGESPASRLSSVPFLGKVARRLQQSPLFASPAYELHPVQACGLVNIPASPNYFKPSHGVRRLLDALSLYGLSMSGAVRGIEQAANENKVFHLRAHPCEFQTQKDWEKLRHVLGRASEQVGRGKLRSITMADLATKALTRQKCPR